MESPTDVGCQRSPIRTPTELATERNVTFYGFLQINAVQF